MEPQPSLWCFLRGGYPRFVARIASPPPPSRPPKIQLFRSSAASWALVRQPWRQDVQTSPEIAKKTPSWSQSLPTYLPKPSQGSLQDPPEEAPTPKTPPKVIECWSFLHFGHFSQDLEKSHEKCSQDPQKSSQTEANMVILALS